MSSIGTSDNASSAGDLVQRAQEVLASLHLAPHLQSVESGLTLLGLLGVGPRTSWELATPVVCTEVSVRAFIEEEYDAFIKEWGQSDLVKLALGVANFRVILQSFAAAGLVQKQANYGTEQTQAYLIDSKFYTVVMQFGTESWSNALQSFLSNRSNYSEPDGGVSNETNLFESAGHLVRQASEILTAIKLPPELQSFESGLTLLALLGIRPSTGWERTERVPRTATSVRDFISTEFSSILNSAALSGLIVDTVLFGKLEWALQLFDDNGLVQKLPEQSASEEASYLIEDMLFNLFKEYGKETWLNALQSFLTWWESRSDLGLPQRPQAPLRAAYFADRVASGDYDASGALNDALGVEVYAKHLAKLIAAKDTPMPLSVGLFGAWGSGKSYFIALLDQNLKTLCSGKSKVYHEKVVRVHFNAWHYLDTNLWANLVSEIFDHVFRELSDTKVTPETQVTKLKEELSANSALALEAKEALRTAHARREKAESELNSAREQRVKSEGKVNELINDLQVLVTDANVKTKLDEVAGTFGLPKIASSFTELEKTVRELRSLAPRVIAITMSVFTGRGWWRGALLLGLAVLLPLVIAVLVQTDTWGMKQLLSGAWQTIVEVTASLGSICALGAKAIKTGSNSIQKLEEVYEAAKIAREKQTALTPATEALAELSARRLDEEMAMNTLAALESKIRALAAEIAEFAPGRQLFRFLKERATTDDYTRHLGLVSIVRKDFAKLSELLNKSTAADGSDLPHIDRIVLYIDDLDRCRTDRVIEVLEAVHLLLAFPLFAVIVAVDPRWLRQSLLDHYPRLLGGEREESNVQTANILGHPATPTDYLEKIFQVPFNLQPMEKGGFDALVEQLFPARTTPDQSIAIPNISNSALADTSGLGGTTVLTSEGLNPNPPEGTPETNLSNTAVPSGAHGEGGAKSPAGSDTGGETDTLELDPERLTLSREEVRDIEILQPLFQTPRSLKRLANTYVLLRVGMEGDDWQSVSSSQSANEYRTPLLMLAVASSFPSLAHPWLHWLLEGAKMTWQFDSHELRTLTERYAGSTDSADWKRLSLALEAIDLGAWPSPDTAILQKWAPRVARYSF